jgi:hypothetical protein
MQNILNKLHKFTSAQEPIKVELAKVSELASLVNQSRNVESEMVDAFVKARSISKAGIQAGEKHLQNLKEINRLAQDVKSASEELGIDVSSVKEWKQAMDFLNGNPERPTQNMIDKMKSLL